MKQHKRGASWSISQKEMKSEKIRLGPINRYFAMVPRKYLETFTNAYFVVLHSLLPFKEVLESRCLIRRRGRSKEGEKQWEEQMTDRARAFF